MKLTVNNIDRNLRVELAQICEIVGITNSPDGVFLEWSTEGHTFEKQTEIIEKCVKKKIPMIIFDRNQEIIPDEVSYLVSIGAFLWEPAVADRNFFSFQPVWGKLKKFEDIPLVENSDGIDLVYMQSLSKKLASFKNYFQPVSEIGDFRVAFIDRFANSPINRKVDEMGITVIAVEGTVPVKSTILLGSDHDYQTGRLDPHLFEYLEAGIVPMLPREHRWFHSVFDDLVVGTEDDVEFILKTYNSIAFGTIYDVYRNLDAYLPECDVKNVAKRINKYFS